MFLSIFKKKNKSLIKKTDKKNHRIAIFGMNVYVDWYIILSIGVILMLTSIYHSYFKYQNVINSTEIEIKESGDSNKVDIDKLNKVLNRFN